MFLMLDDFSYVPISSIRRHNESSVEFISPEGTLCKKELSRVSRDAIDVISNKYIEALDKNEDVAIIPLNTITAIRKMTVKNKNICYNKVSTISGEVFYISNDLYQAIETLTLQGLEFGEVP